MTLKNIKKTIRFSDRPAGQKTYIVVTFILMLYVTAYMAFIKDNTEHLSYPEQHALQILSTLALVNHIVCIIWIAWQGRQLKKKEEENRNLSK